MIYGIKLKYSLIITFTFNELSACILNADPMKYHDINSTIFNVKRKKKKIWLFLLNFIPYESKYFVLMLVLIDPVRNKKNK